MPASRTGSDRGAYRRGGMFSLLFGCGGLFAAVLATGFGYLAWANAPLPPPESDDPRLPDPNGYDICVAAVSNLPLPTNETLRHPDSSPLWEIRRVLSTPEKASDTVRAALNMEYRNPPFLSFGTLLPELPRYRYLARRWTAQARVARIEGNHSAAIEHCLDAMELGSRIPHGGATIHHLVGAACRNLPLYQAELCIPQLTAPAARTAGRRLDRIIAQSARAAEAVKIDRRVVLAHTRAIFRGQFALEIPIAIDIPVAGYLPDSMAMTWYPKTQVYRSMEAHYREIIAEQRKPFPSQRLIARPRNIFARALIWDFRNLAEATTACATASHLLRLELALQEYRGIHGRFPARLGQLAPAILDRIPRDPFTTQPFRYRRTHKGYLLYSLGYDGKDDGGTPIAKRKRGFTAGPGDFVAGKLKEKD